MANRMPRAYSDWFREVGCFMKSAFLSELTESTAGWPGQRLCVPRKYHKCWNGTQRSRLSAVRDFHREALDSVLLDANVFRPGRNPHAGPLHRTAGFADVVVGDRHVARLAVHVDRHAVG